MRLVNREQPGYISEAADNLYRRWLYHNEKEQNFTPLNMQMAYYHLGLKHGIELALDQMDYKLIEKTDQLAG
ncbi:hypothetical protein [Salipaludibacillus aurantiacus]|uniref:Uncharacterized protein n=1 Tax=Salipaludibacillus aurantiacus TaxID=1601833 RepID=A0A1H9U202_9BACI|nr:hypothetical protein [Salipaludibacillus aurantiacus]SES03184.1 hypothetical protein SAMN05518684_106232 [Salipaludibacillus aurantiacus]